jgi:hypothetical protein
MRNSAAQRRRLVKARPLSDGGCVKFGVVLTWDYLFCQFSGINGRAGKGMLRNDKSRSLGALRNDIRSGLGRVCGPQVLSGLGQVGGFA